MYAREVRSRNSRRNARNKGGTTTKRPSLTLLMSFRARVSRHHSPCRAAVRICRAAMELTYKAIRQDGIPPTVVISAPGLLVGSGMDPVLRGFLHAEPGARLHKMAHSGALMLRFRGGDRERSSTSESPLPASDKQKTLLAPRTSEVVSSTSLHLHFSEE